MPLRNVLVLFGGVSTEHMVSRRSAYNIIRGLRAAGLEVCTIGITEQGEWLRYEGPDENIADGSWQEQAAKTASNREPAACPTSPRTWIESICGYLPDVVFPAMHGINCEDGTLQGLLELSRIPYVGCGVLASAAGMDKHHSKVIFAQAGIPQCRYIAASRLEIEQDLTGLTVKVAEQLGFPCFLKPNQGGSSVGTRKVDRLEELAEALKEAAVFDRTVLIEEFIKAREIEAAVIGNESPEIAVLGEISTADHIGYYDYETKYFSEDGARVLLPAPLSPELTNRIKRYAIEAYKALGCRGLSRVDFFLQQENDTIYINEINTLPGFTPISVYPKAMAASGYSIEKLVLRLCELAIDEHGQNQRQERV